MLRLRRKRQETLARLKKISKESQENSLEFGQIGVSQKVVLSHRENLTDSRNIQETKNNKNNNSKLPYTPGTINLNSREDVMYFEEKNHEVNNKTVDIEACEEDTNHPLPVGQACRTSSYSLTNLPLFRRTFLPNNFVFAISLVFPKQTRFYLVQHKQIEYLTTKDTRFCQIRKRVKGAYLCIVIRFPDNTNKTKFNYHVILYSISPLNVNKPTTSTNTKNAYSDLWSPDNNSGGCTCSHLTGLHQTSIIPVRSKRTLYFLYTCFQTYHSPFVILFSNFTTTTSQNSLLTIIDINIKLNRFLFSFCFSFLLFSGSSFFFSSAFLLSFIISTTSDRFIRLVILGVVCHSGNKSNGCRIKITKTTKNLLIEELVINWILFISIAFVLGCSGNRLDTIELFLLKIFLYFLLYLLLLKLGECSLRYY